jgi:hypothetical protein
VKDFGKVVRDKLGEAGGAFQARRPNLVKLWIAERLERAA